MARRYKQDRRGSWHDVTTGRFITATPYLRRVERRGVPAAARYPVPEPEIVTPREMRAEFAGLRRRERRRRVPEWEPPEPGEYQLLGTAVSVGVDDIATAFAEAGILSKVEDLPRETRIRLTISGTYQGEPIEIPPVGFDLGIGCAGPDFPMAHSNQVMFHAIRALTAATQGEEKGYRLMDIDGEVTWIVEAVG